MRASNIYKYKKRPLAVTDDSDEDDSKSNLFKMQSDTGALNNSNKSNNRSIIANKSYLLEDSDSDGECKILSNSANSKNELNFLKLECDSIRQKLSHSDVARKLSMADIQNENKSNAISKAQTLLNFYRASNAILTNVAEVEPVVKNALGENQQMNIIIPIIKPASERAKEQAENSVKSIIACPPLSTPNENLEGLTLRLTTRLNGEHTHKWKLSPVDTISKVRQSISVHM